jgi:hypothetical protein
LWPESAGRWLVNGWETLLRTFDRLAASEVPASAGRICTGFLVFYLFRTKLLVWQGVQRSLRNTTFVVAEIAPKTRWEYTPIVT